MVKLTFFVLLMSLSAIAENLQQVCVIIDQMDTGNKKYPNQATEIDDHNNSFNVYHQQEACFDLSKKYYMQYFLWETRDAVVYGTRCRYEPKEEDQGKILRFEGFSGGTPCPVVDEIRIDE